MPFEDAKYIDELVDTDPVPNDPVNQGDDQLRQIKLALQANVNGDVDGTQLLVGNLPALDIAQPGPEFPVMTLGAFSQAAKVRLGNVDGDDGAFLDNVIDAAIVALRGMNVLEVETFVQGVPADHTYLLEGNKVKIRTDLDGADILGDLDNDPNTGGDQDVTLSFLNASGARVAEITYSNTTLVDWQLDNRVLDGLVSLRALGAAGQVTLLQGDPNGEVALFWLGDERLATTSLGFHGEGTVFDLEQQTDNSIILRLLNSIGGARFMISSGSGDAGFFQLDSAGTFEKTWMNLVRDGAVSLSFDGAAKIQTLGTGGQVTGTMRGTVAPTNVSDLTRKDYVDNRAFSDPPNDNRIQVDRVQLLSGRQAAVGQALSVTYASPFTSIPSISLAVESSANNAFGSILTTTTTGFTAQIGVANTTVNWMATGTKSS